jgi:hypothetical protein
MWGSGERSSGFILSRMGHGLYEQSSYVPRGVNKLFVMEYRDKGIESMSGHGACRGGQSTPTSHRDPDGPPPEALSDAQCRPTGVNAACSDGCVPPYSSDQVEHPIPQKGSKMPSVTAFSVVGGKLGYYYKANKEHG